MIPKIGTGDDGKTSTYSGQRVAKNAKLIKIAGVVDEVLSLLGITLSQDLEAESKEILEVLPHIIFDIGAEISGEGKFVAENITEAEVKKMDEWIEKLDAKMPELKAFILPGGSASSEWIDFVRTAVRHVERKITPLFEEKKIRKEIFTFLNRLSRLLFSLERWENFSKNETERLWEKGKVLPNFSEKGKV